MPGRALGQLALWEQVKGLDTACPLGTACPLDTAQTNAQTHNKSKARRKPAHSLAKATEQNLMTGGRQHSANHFVASLPQESHILFPLSEGVLFSCFMGTGKRIRCLDLILRVAQKTSFLRNRTQPRPLPKDTANPKPGESQVEAWPKPRKRTG